MNKASVLAFFLAVVPPVLAQSTPSGLTPEEAKKAEAYFHFSMARVLDQDQDWDTSIQEYMKALEIRPNDSEIYSAMARTYMNRSKPDEARAAAQKAIELNRNNLGAHRFLAEFYLDNIRDMQTRRQVSPAVLQETFNNAIHEYEEVVRIDAGARDAYLWLGQLYRINDQTDKATEIYRKFLGIEPSSEDGVVALASLAMDSNQNAEAIDLLNDFLMRQPNAAKALEVLGDAYTNLGDTAGAADAYKRAAALNDDSDLRDKLADALYEDNRLDEAARLYETILKDDQGNPQIFQRLAQIYRRQMKYTEARDLLNRALRRTGNTSLSIRFDLALVNRDEGKFEDAIRDFESLLKDTEKANYNQTDKRTRAAFYTQIGIIQSLLTRFDAAVDAFNNVRSLTDFSERSRVDLMIADAYRDAKQLDKAEAVIQSSLMEFPEDVGLRMASADMLAVRGRTDDSVRALRDLAGTSEPDLPLLSAIIGVYERADKFSDAQQVLDGAIQRFPDDKEVYFLQGALFERQEKFSDAETSFRKALELDKNDPSVLNYLGYMLADRGLKLDEALSMIKRAVDADPINGAFLDSLGWVYFKMDMLDLAEQFLKRAVAFAATNATMHDHLGDLYFKTGRLEEAKASWTKGLEYADEAEEASRIRQKLDQLATQAANR